MACGMMSPAPGPEAYVRSDRVAALLKDLVGFASVNPPGDEGEIASYVAEILRRLDCQVRLQEVAPGRPNVIGVLKGGGGPSLLFNTHLDVVPAGSGWTGDPFRAEVRDGRIVGRGSADAKGSLAAMLEAVQAVRESGARLRGTVIVTAVCDEEMASGGTRALVREVRADMGVVGEPTACRVCIAHKGSSRPVIVVRGRSAHAAEPDAGVNAIQKATHVLQALDRYAERLRSRAHPLLGPPTAVVTMIKGGTKGNMVPDTCEITLDRRMVPGESEASVAAELEEVFRELRRAAGPIEVGIDRFPQTTGGPTETPADHALVSLALEAVRRVTGEAAHPHGFTPNCDMSHLRGAGIPTIILGPGETKISHQPDEWIAVEELARGARIYADLIARALGEGQG